MQTDEQRHSSLAMGWRICRYLAIVTQPFLPFSARKLWSMLGIEETLEEMHWDDAIDWSAPVQSPTQDYEPLFKRLDVEEIVREEQSFVEETSESQNITHAVKGGKKEKKKMEKETPEGMSILISIPS